jgi:tetratricopeptide (TPR) repeat protein
VSLDAQLARLESSQLVRRTDELEPAYQFKHNLTQETAYQSLLLRRRRQIHKHVAEAYERLYADRLEEHAAMLAQHYAEVGDDAKTLEYASSAGDAAARVYANSEAVANYSLALQAASRAKFDAELVAGLYARRGRALEVAGRQAEALANYVEEETLGRERNSRRLELAALIARATIHSIPSNYHDAAMAQSLSDRALELAQELNDRAAEAKILWNLMLLYSRTDTRFRQAIEKGELALAIARDLNLREQLAYLLNDLGPVYVIVGQPERGLRYGEEARRMWRTLDNLAMLSDNFGYAAMNHVQTGDFSQAILDSQECLQISKKIGNLWGEAFARAWVGVGYKELGLVSEAIAVMEEAVRLGEQVFPPNLTTARADLARLYADLGAVERGSTLADLALQASETSTQFLVPFAAGTRAHLALAQGNIVLAESMVERGRRFLDPESPSMFIGAYVPLAECELVMAKGECARAIGLADAFIAERRHSRLRLHLPNALLLKGTALERLGRLVEANQVLSEAQSEADAMQARWTSWRILAALARVESGQGNEKTAIELRAKAIELVDFIVKHTPPDLRKSFLNLQDVNALVGARQEA